MWKTPLWSDFYFPSGTVILSSASHAVGSSYVKKALAVNKDPKLAVEGKSVASLDGPEAFQARYPKEVEKGTFEGEVGYFNPHCGWANARGAMDAVCDRVRAAGVSFAVGEAASLVYEDERAGKDVKGVRTKAGETLMADLVILATGSWTASLLPEMGNELLATGQVVATIQLTQEEADQYRSGPVSLCMDTGFYLFPVCPSYCLHSSISPLLLSTAHLRQYHQVRHPRPRLPQSLLLPPRLPLSPSHHLDSRIRSRPNPPRGSTGTPRRDHTNLPWSSREEVGWNEDLLVRFALPFRWSKGADTFSLAGTATALPRTGSLISILPTPPSSSQPATADTGSKSVSPPPLPASQADETRLQFLPIMGELILGALQGTLDEVQKATWGFDRLQVNKGDASRGWAPTERKVLRTEEMVRPDEI